MGQVVFNIAKGAAVAAFRDQAGWPPGLGWDAGVLLLQGTVNDATLVDLDTVAAVVSTFTELQAAGYQRKTLSAAEVRAFNGGMLPDDQANAVDIGLPSQLWEGVAAGFAVSKVVVYAAPPVGATDSTRLPLTAHDFTHTTTGAPFAADFPAGYYEAT